MVLREIIGPNIRSTLLCLARRLTGRRYIINDFGKILVEILVIFGYVKYNFTKIKIVNFF